MNSVVQLNKYGFGDFFKLFAQTAAGKVASILEQQTNRILRDANHGDFEKWLQVLTELPETRPSVIDLNNDAITIGSLRDIHSTALRVTLMKLHPWRKGPFELFGTLIDTEWRSHLKWARVSQAIEPLQGRVVLDLGCGNGYYLWRMLGEGVKCALGIDPSLLFFTQFQVFQKYIRDFRAAVLPLGVEDLPPMSGFDTVFSMGLLYHRRDPLEHLKQAASFLRPGGEFVIESLVIDGICGDVLRPGERYAKMRNVWNVPSCATLEKWLRETGFKNVRCVDVTVTTVHEQRKTEWMTFESLEDFLDPKDSSKTVEGYSAPKRAIFIAQK